MDLEIGKFNFTNPWNNNQQMFENSPKISNKLNKLVMNLMDGLDS